MLFEEASWISRPQFSNGQDSTDQAHEQREGEDKPDSRWCHQHDEPRGAGKQLIESERYKPAWEKAEEGQIKRLLQDEFQEIDRTVAHGFERGKFGDMVRDIGKEYLVADDRTHDQAHDRPDGEDDSDRCSSRPEVDFALDDLLFRQDIQFQRAQLHQFRSDLIDVLWIAQLHQANIDDRQRIVAWIAK